MVLASLITLPANAGNLKILIAPTQLSAANSDILARRSVQPPTGIADLGFALEFGSHRDAFALDYYSVTSTYEYTTAREYPNAGDPLTSFEFKDELKTTAWHLGYRRHGKRGFYFGLGAILIDPEVDRDAVISEGQGAISGTHIPFKFDFESVWAPAITLGHDYTFKKSGLILGSHFISSYPVTSKDKKSPAELTGLYMLSFSFSIGFDW